MIERNLRDRYSRQTIFPQIGEAGQARLLKSNAIIIGCGALGGNIANLLVRAGVGKIRIVDRDFVEYHNLHRQVLFNEADIKAGLPKAIAAERHLRKVNSTTDVKGIVADINFSNIEDLCHGADVILDGTDNFETRFLINDFALKYRIPWIYGGAVASSGMTMNIIPGETPCFRCIYSNVPAPDRNITSETAGIIGTLPAIIGSIQATEAIKILIRAPEINREMILIDVWTDNCDHIKIKANKECPACNGNYGFLTTGFTLKTSFLGGRSQAIQVVNTRVKTVSLSKIAAQLCGVNNLQKRKYMLRFEADDKEFTLFPDGRIIIRNTADESEAKRLYDQYIGRLLSSK